VYTGGEYIDIISKIWILESVGDEKTIVVVGPHEKRFGNRHKNIVRIVSTLFVMYIVRFTTIIQIIIKYYTFVYINSPS